VPFWQTIASLVVASILLAGMLVLWTRLAIVRATAVASSPATPIPPAALTEQAAIDRLAELAAELATVRAEWKAHQRHLDAYLEAFNDLEETVEHKRRRTTAAASKIQREQEQPAEAPNAQAALLARARNMGLPV
jgi:septal ring factor EnvC (AmiA/AmiB activator)